MKTVLHIITGLGNGGAEAVLYRLCAHDRHNCHHVISLSDAGKYGSLLDQAAVPVTCLGMPRGRLTLRGLQKMWRTIRRVRPDVIQTWMYHANLLGGIVARLAGQRNVCWGIRQGMLLPDRISPRTIMINHLSAHLSRWVPRCIICCAQHARKVHTEVGYDPKKMRVIPNGYDFSTFQRDPEAGSKLRTECGLAGSELVIGFVARFHPLKDHANLFRALVLLRDSMPLPVCLLVGTGMSQENGELVEMIAEFGLSDRVRLLGPRSDIPAVMNALDLHVMSSTGEGFPNVLAEAMACGTPCVSTDVGDASVILGGIGRIVPPRDPVALAAAIADMLTERESSAWPSYREAARRHISGNFSLGRMLDSYHQVWFENDAPA